MAGFLSRIGNGFLNFGTISDKVKNLSVLGMRFNDEVVKNSKALGVSEASFTEKGDIPPEMQFALAMSDTTSLGNKYIACFDREYKNKKEFLRKFSMNGEVEWCVEIISDETIIYNDSNFFCQAKVDVDSFLDKSKADEVKTSLEVNFKRIYTYFGFQTGALAWQIFKQWLIDGIIAFEIIYNEANTSIIGFKQLEPESLEPRMEKTPDGMKQVWVQYPNEPKMMRTLADSQIIYISFAKGNFISRVSYVERLVRSHNLLRLMEHTRVIWNIMNATFRMKMVVPVGTQSRQRSQESLNELLAKYKEDLYLDYDSGELLVNGKASMQFYKNYLIPKKDGDSPEIESVSNDGPELQDTQIIDFFFKKFKIDSKIPFSRFSRDGSAAFTLTAEIDQEERMFSKFIGRLRTLFAEIIIKPLLIQMTLDHPELQDNELFLSGISLKYHQDASFEELKQIELISKKVDFINNLAGINDNVTNEPYFSTEYLIKYLGLGDVEIGLNKEIMERQKPKDE